MGNGNCLARISMNCCSVKTNSILKDVPLDEVKNKYFCNTNIEVQTNKKERSIRSKKSSLIIPLVSGDNTTFCKNSIKKKRKINNENANINKSLIELNDKSSMDSNIINEISSQQSITKRSINYSNQNCKTNQINNYGNIDLFTGKNFSINLDLDKHEREIINYTNIIRKSPKTFINEINFILDNNIEKDDEEKYILNDNTDEKILLGPYISIEDTINFLNNAPSLESLEWNKDLKIDFSQFNASSDNNVFLELEGNLFLYNIISDYASQIQKKYPNCLFWPSIIKDYKICLLYLLSDKSQRHSFRDKLFSPKYTQYYMSRTKGYKNRFFCVICLA